jgi:hypothetical protein
MVKNYRNDIRYCKLDNQSNIITYYLFDIFSVSVIDYILYTMYDIQKNACIYCIATVLNPRGEPPKGDVKMFKKTAKHKNVIFDYFDN